VLECMIRAVLRSRVVSQIFVFDFKSYTVAIACGVCGVSECCQALQRGDQVFDSYGQKCNSRFLVNYGFALEENEMDNEVIFGLQMARTDPLYDMKLRYLGGQPRR
jgi:hypothetical protein